MYAITLQDLATPIYDIRSVISFDVIVNFLKLIVVYLAFGGVS